VEEQRGPRGRGRSFALSGRWIRGFSWHSNYSSDSGSILSK
jgi:hypothetical protein